MRKEIFLPIRQRRDGSVYFRKRKPVWSAVGESVAVVLFIVTLLLLLALAIVQTPARAQEANPSTAKLVISPNALNVLKEEPAHAEPEDFPGEVVRAETTTTPSLWPLQGKLTDGFGNRRNPFHRKSSEFHPGQDIAAPKGTPVSVTADGTVIFAGCKKGYGQLVIVDHGNNISTRYGHLSLIETALGTLIKRGGQIGLVGSTGRSTGSHLHYEVRVGVDQVPVNPLAYLPTSPPAAAAK